MFDNKKIIALFVALGLLSQPFLAAKEDCSCVKKLSQEALAENPRVLTVTPSWVLFLDSNQAHLGKMALWCRRHLSDIKDLSTAEWIELHDLIAKVEELMVDKIGAVTVQLTKRMDNAMSSGNPMHLHFHLVPRYDHSFSYDGFKIQDPCYGNSYMQVKDKILSDKECQRYVEYFRRHLLPQ